MKSKILIVLGLLAVFIISAVNLIPSLRRYSPLRQSPSTDSSANALTFAVVGDTESHADLFQRVLEEAKARGAQFLLHTGDVSEDGSLESLREMRSVADASGLPLYTVLGSHDIRTDPARQTFQTLFNAPNLAFEAGGWRFLLLDNADRSVGFSQATLAWLAQDLADHPAAQYILAYHRPFNLPLAAIVGDDETPSSRATNDRFREIVGRANVKAIFTGHLHIYFPYTMNGIPVYITGGGGAEAQTALGPLGNQPPHFLLVKTNNGNLNVEVIRLVSDR